MNDLIASAAASVAQAAVAAPEAPEGKEAKPKAQAFPSPMKYDGNAFAVRINKFLDKAGDPDPGSILSAPASTVMVAECGMAAAEAWGLNSSKESQIHPGYLLAMAVVAYLIMVGLHHFLNGRKPAPKTQEGPKADASLL